MSFTGRASSENGGVGRDGIASPLRGGPKEGPFAGNSPSPSVDTNPQERAKHTPGPKVGDMVRVSSGPAYVKGQPIRGRVEEVTPVPGDAEVMIRVPSGGLWGFMASHLTVTTKAEGR